MALLSICPRHKWGEFIWFPLSGLSLSIKILPHHSCRSVSWEMREWDAGLICARLSKQSSDWQAIQLSGSETEWKIIITSIISHSSTFCCQTLSLLSKWALYFHWKSLICYDGPAPTWKTNAFSPPLQQISKEQRLGATTAQSTVKMPELWNKCPWRPRTMHEYTK